MIWLVTAIGVVAMAGLTVLIIVMDQVHEVLLAIQSQLLRALDRQEADTPEPSFEMGPMTMRALSEMTQLLYKGKHHGWREAGHPDIEEALNTPGMSVRYPDGTVVGEDCAG